MRAKAAILVGVSGAALALSGCAANRPTTARVASDTDACAAVRDRSRVGAGSAQRCYSGADLERTGYTTVGDALALLDPSITVHR